MKPHILLVEQERTIAVTLAPMLRQADYRVTEATCGDAALELLEKDTFHVVLTDLALTDMSGLDVLHMSRRQSARPAVIILTRQAALETALLAFRGGAYDYLEQPCPSEELLACVSRAVQRQAAENQLRAAVQTLFGLPNDPTGATHRSGPYEPGRLIQIGDLLIGQSRHAVTFQGEPVSLTPIEYLLVSCLASTPGQTRSYSDIVRYTHHCNLSENDAQVLIRPHIHHLRKKLTPDYLVNDRSIGYRLVNPEEST